MLRNVIAVHLPYVYMQNLHHHPVLFRLVFCQITVHIVKYALNERYSRI